MQKGCKAYSSRLRESDWSAMTHYLLSVWNSYEQNLFTREFRGVFWTSKSLHYAEQKKLHQRVLTECFEKHLEKDIVLFGFSKKKLFGTLPPLLNKPMGFIAKHLENSSKIVLSKVLPASRCRGYGLWFHAYMHIFYWIQYNFKWGWGQIVFSISQTR